MVTLRAMIPLVLGLAVGVAATKLLVDRMSKARASATSEAAGALNIAREATARANKCEGGLCALKAFDTAIETYMGLTEEEGRRDLIPNLAIALGNRGVVQQNVGRLDASLEDYTRAIELFRELVSSDRHSNLADDLAANLVNRATVLVSKGAWDVARSDIEAAMRIARDEIIRGRVRQLHATLMSTKEEP